MEQIVSVIGFISLNYQAIISAVMALFMGIIAVALLIPGEQPEKTLQAIVDFLSKFSKK